MARNLKGGPSRALSEEERNFILGQSTSLTAHLQLGEGLENSLKFLREKFAGTDLPWERFASSPANLGGSK